MLISWEGKNTVPTKKIAPTAAASFMPMARMCSMAFMFCLPQYWAASMVVPAARPLYTMFRIKWICPAKELEAIAVWLTKPNIKVSAIPTAELIRFWMAMGMTMAKKER